MALGRERIVKQILLNSPVARVWHAIGDSQAFGSWFGMSLEGAFIAGKRLKAKIVPTAVDAEVAKQQEPYEGRTFDLFTFLELRDDAVDLVILVGRFLTGARDDERRASFVDED